MRGTGRETYWLSRVKKRKSPWEMVEVRVVDNSSRGLGAGHYVLRLRDATAIGTSRTQAGVCRTGGASSELVWDPGQVHRGSNTLIPVLCAEERGFVITRFSTDTWEYASYWST